MSNVATAGARDQKYEYVLSFFCTAHCVARLVVMQLDDDALLL